MTVYLRTTALPALPYGEGPRWSTRQELQGAQCPGAILVRETPRRPQNEGQEGAERHQCISSPRKILAEAKAENRRWEVPKC